MLQYLENLLLSEVKYIVMLSITEIQKICNYENIQVTLHAAKRLEQRNISIDDILSAMRSGEIIEQYPDDFPFPSCLILGLSLAGAYIHVVVGTDLSTLWIVTAYYPDKNIWSEDYRYRKEI